MSWVGVLVAIVLVVVVLLVFNTVLELVRNRRQ